MATTLKCYLDEANKLWVCVGPENGCTDRDVTKDGPCDRCIKPKMGETLEEVAARLKEGRLQ